MSFVTFLLPPSPLPFVRAFTALHSSYLMSRLKFYTELSGMTRRLAPIERTRLKRRDRRNVMRVAASSTRARDTHGRLNLQAPVTRTRDLGMKNLEKRKICARTEVKKLPFVRVWNCNARRTSLRAVVVVESSTMINLRACVQGQCPIKKSVTE